MAIASCSINVNSPIIVIGSGYKGTLQTTFFFAKRNLHLFLESPQSEVLEFNSFCIDNKKQSSLDIIWNVHVNEDGLWPPSFFLRAGPDVKESDSIIVVESGSFAKLHIPKQAELESVRGVFSTGRGGPERVRGDVRLRYSAGELLKAPSPSRCRVAIHTSFQAVLDLVLYPHRVGSQAAAVTSSLSMPVHSNRVEGTLSCGSCICWSLFAMSWGSIQTYLTWAANPCWWPPPRALCASVHCPHDALCRRSMGGE